jgi:translation elongation factor EF-G
VIDDAIESLKNKLHITPLIVQVPLGEERQFRGVVDLVDMTLLEWNDEVLHHSPRSYCYVDIDNGACIQQADDTGATYVQRALEPSDNVYGMATSARESLITQLCELDDTLMDAYLSDGLTSSVFTPQRLRQAIRDATISLRGVAILCGASLRNKGVQPLLDAIVNYLPSPADRPSIPSSFVARKTNSSTTTGTTITGGSTSSTNTSAQRVATIVKIDIDAPTNTKQRKSSNTTSSSSSSPSSSTTTTATTRSNESSDGSESIGNVMDGPLINGDENGPLCALAFKVSHDPQTGPLVFVRVYSGKLHLRDVIINSSNNLFKERAMRVVEVHADSSRDLDVLQVHN